MQVLLVMSLTGNSFGAKMSQLKVSVYRKVILHFIPNFVLSFRRLCSLCRKETMHILLVMSLTGKFFEAKVPQLNVSV